jgi:cystathionine beta-lyase/cystathionine gamma-synthase
MLSETIALRAGFDHDPATQAVAVPIYQSVALTFSSADHGAALFNLKEEGFRCSRIANTTVAALVRSPVTKNRLMKLRSREQILPRSAYEAADATRFFRNWTAQVSARCAVSIHPAQ